MSDPGSICIKDYDYALPPEQIAQFPLASRDASRLLIYNEGNITEGVFSEIDQVLPENSLLVFNNTRVIRARLIFTKSTGGQIEIFCLEPLTPSSEVQSAFHQQTASTWKCLVGNLKRWKSGALSIECRHQGFMHQLIAERVGDCGDGSFEIAFHWNPPEKTFSEILELMGKIPLPPYINRPAEPSDNDRYQTIYADREGSVAAPTAGLHFTDSLLNRLSSKGIETDNVTLHVGVGTFRPVSAERIGDHVMHHEKIVISKTTIERLYTQLSQPVFAVGTTSARTLESIYWLGVKLICEGQLFHPMVGQWDPYLLNPVHEISVAQSLEAMIGYLDRNNMLSFPEKLN